MACFKADSRYTAHVDDAPDDSHSCDEHFDDHMVHIPTHMKHVFSTWKRDNWDALEPLFLAYMKHGRAVFGGAFHQTGTIETFANFVFKYMQPGAL